MIVPYLEVSIIRNTYLPHNSGRFYKKVGMTKNIARNSPLAPRLSGAYMQVQQYWRILIG